MADTTNILENFINTLSNVEKDQENKFEHTTETQMFFGYQSSLAYNKPDLVEIEPIVTPVDIDFYRNVSGQENKKIIPISNEIKEEIFEIIKRKYQLTYGVSDDMDEMNAVKAYLETLSPEKRGNAGFSVGQFSFDVNKQLTAKIREYNFDWKVGTPFDTSILDDFKCSTSNPKSINTKA